MWKGINQPVNSSHFHYNFSQIVLQVGSRQWGGRPAKSGKQWLFTTLSFWLQPQTGYETQTHNPFRTDAFYRTAWWNEPDSKKMDSLFLAEAQELLSSESATGAAEELN